MLQLAGGLGGTRERVPDESTRKKIAGRGTITLGKGKSKNDIYGMDRSPRELRHVLNGRVGSLLLRERTKPLPNCKEGAISGECLGGGGFGGGGGVFCGQGGHPVPLKLVTGFWNSSCRDGGFRGGALLARGAGKENTSKGCRKEK